MRLRFAAIDSDVCVARSPQVFRGHKKEAASLAWHPIHETLFSSGGSDGSLMFWNVGSVTNEIQFQFKIRPIAVGCLINLLLNLLYVN